MLLQTHCGCIRHPQCHASLSKISSVAVTYDKTWGEGREKRGADSAENTGSVLHKHTMIKKQEQVVLC